MQISSSDPRHPGPAGRNWQPEHRCMIRFNLIIQSSHRYVVQAQLQLEVQLDSEVQLLATALLLVGIVSSSCSDSELSFGSVVGDSEDLKLKFKFKFKFKFPVISECPGRAQCCLSTTNSTLHSELLESDSESVLVSYSDSARGSESS
jgi:hypothetical protein